MIVAMTPVPTAAALARTALYRAAWPSLRSVRLVVWFTMFPSLVRPQGLAGAVKGRLRRMAGDRPAVAGDPGD